MPFFPRETRGGSCCDRPISPVSARLPTRTWRGFPPFPPREAATSSGGSVPPPRGSPPFPSFSPPPPRGQKDRESCGRMRSLSRERERDGTRRALSPFVGKGSPERGGGREREGREGRGGERRERRGERGEERRGEGERGEERERERDRETEREGESGGRERGREGEGASDERRTAWVGASHALCLARCRHRRDSTFGGCVAMAVPYTHLTLPTKRIV